MTSTTCNFILLLSSLPLIVFASPIDVSSMAAFSLSKRFDNVIPLDDCPAPFQFFGSRCIRESINRLFEVNCYTADHSRVIFPRGVCPENTLCVDGARRPGGSFVGSDNNLWPTAYCVHTENFVRIAKDVVGTQPSEITTQYQAPENAQVGAFQAILTDSDGIDGAPVNASSFSIDAQVSHVLAGVTSWRSILQGGSDTCNDCAAVAIQTVPPATQRIDVKVSLAAGVTSALLYLVPVTS